MSDLGTWTKIEAPPIMIRTPITKDRVVERTDTVSGAGPIHTETFEDRLPPAKNLGPEETVLAKYWLAPGSWKVYAEATLRRATPGPDFTQAYMTLKAEPSDLYPLQRADQATQTNSPLACTLYARSAQTMLVTLSAVIWTPAPGVLESIRVLAGVE